MGFENFNLDEVAENAHKRSTRDGSAGDLYLDSVDGKIKVRKPGQALPKSAVVSTQMTDEGFAS